jgi:tRNA(adenine34) deaminase
MNHPQLNHKVLLTPHILAEECGTLLTNFFRKRRQQISSARILQNEAIPIRETAMATRKTATKKAATKKTATKKKWSAKVDTDSTHPDEGLFNQDAETIAEHLASKKVSPKGPASGMRMLNFYINRAGHNLSSERHQELEKAKGLLSGIIAKQKDKPKKSAAKSTPKTPAKKATKKSARKVSSKKSSKK